MGRPFLLEAGMARIGVSIGAAHAAPGERDLDSLLGQADQLMYEVKRSRKAGRPRRRTRRPAWADRHDAGSRAPRPHGPPAEPAKRRRRRFSLNGLAIQLSAFALSFTLVALLVVSGSQAAFVEENEAVADYVPIGATAPPERTTTPAGRPRPDAAAPGPAVAGPPVAVADDPVAEEPDPRRPSPRSSSPTATRAPRCSATRRCSPGTPPSGASR